MRSSFAKSIANVACAAAISLIAGGVFAGDVDHRKVVNGLTVHFGIVPVDRLRSFPEESEEAAAHISIPAGRDVQHLVVAVFEGKEMKRVTDVDVYARVREPGLAWTTKHLGPTTLNGATTFCNYFTLHDHRDYVIDIDIKRADTNKTVTAEFDYRSG
ncbi:MAG: hypothetical protein ACE5FS_10575 [Paracoccaceae bacterium]